MKPSDKTPSSQPTQAAVQPKAPEDPRPTEEIVPLAKKYSFPALALTAKPHHIAGKRAVEMADGTYRTEDQAIVGPPPAPFIPPKGLLAKIPARYGVPLTKYLSKFPAWVPPTVLVSALIVIGVAIWLITTGGGPFVSHVRSINLPSSGTINADGRDYSVKSAAFVLPDRVQNWTAQIAKSKAGEGRDYTSLDGTCQAEVTRTKMTNDRVTLDSAIAEAKKDALTQMRVQKAETKLPAIKLKDSEGDQMYEFLRQRYSYTSQTDQSLVTEVAVRTLGGYRLQIVSTCSQTDWDQNDAGRDAIVNAVRIAVE